MSSSPLDRRASVNQEMSLTFYSGERTLTAGELPG